MNLIPTYNQPETVFSARTGKLILYHGWADQNIAPLSTVEYYEEGGLACWER